MSYCTRRLQFCAGHRVYGHENKCANLHGHNYVALVTAHAPELDDIGRVVDFSVLKQKVGGWIDEHWDHGMILHHRDPARVCWIDEDPPGITAIFGGHKLYLMDCNPTAENMAEHLLEVCNTALFIEDPLDIARIRLWETENCYADAIVATSDPEHNFDLIDSIGSRVEDLGG